MPASTRARLGRGVAPEAAGGTDPHRRRWLAALGVAATSMLPTGAAAGTCQPLLDHRFPDLVSGQPVPLCRFAGRVLLVVNTASHCGFTRQYEQLEAMHRRYGARGLAVVGFPSNDFGQQEPGSSREIAEFCKANFGVTFQMFERMPVSGRAANPLHAELARRTGQAPRWNFHKYLVDRRAEAVLSFDTQTRPDDARIVREVERLLAGPRPA